MKYRESGRTGVKLSAIGLGCMGMRYAYGPIVIPNPPNALNNPVIPNPPNALNNPVIPNPPNALNNPVIPNPPKAV